MANQAAPCDWVIPYESAESVIKSALAKSEAAEKKLKSLQITKSELILNNPPFRSCHASTIIEINPQELLVAFFGGTKEGAKDVAIWACRLEAGKWSAPYEIASGEGQPCWNPVLFQIPGEELLLFYKVGDCPRTWRGMLKRSQDGGKTWSDPESLPEGVFGPVRNKPLLLADQHTLLCGSSVEVPPRESSRWYCEMNITTDKGKTWVKSEPLEYSEKASAAGAIQGIIQPTLFADRAGVVHMLCRSKNVGYICHASSSDNGRSWSSVAKTTLENPNCGIDAVALKDGPIALIYNPIQAHRNKLALALSEDGGVTWQQQHIMLEDHLYGEYSYPAIIQTSDGLIHITYTNLRTNIKHIAISID